MVKVSMPRVKENVKVKTLYCFLLLMLAPLACSYFLYNQIIDFFENGTSMIKAPNSITLYDSFLIDAKIISTKQKVDLKGTGEKKPKLYLHVGPAKHGTTSLQCALARIQKELNSDNYYYIGINNNECTAEEWTGQLPEFGTQQSVTLVDECFSKLDDCDTSLWQSFLDVLNQYRARKDINVIYSFESFGDIDFTVQASKERFLRLTDQWDVKILLNYRHYHDWVPSFYTEMYKQFVLLRGRGELWPDEGGAHMPSFPDCFDDRFEKPLSDEMKDLYTTNSLTIYRTYLQMFDNVSVMDLHEGHTIENLICSLPGADTACAKVSLMNIERINVGSEYTELIMYDLIVLAAHKAGLIDQELTRGFVRDEVQKHAKTLDANYILPLKCLSTVQEEKLYKLSAKLADVMPVNSTVDSTFGAAISANKFCGVDTEKVLADKNWVDFLHALSN